MKPPTRFILTLCLSVPFVVCLTLSANSQTFTLGQKYEGGIIFYIDSTGNHGLIASITDLGKTLGRQGGLNKDNLERADKEVTSKPASSRVFNTQDCGDDATCAERMCTYYSVAVGNVTYRNWYLPSKYELNLLYEQKKIVGGFSDDFYWSSTMDDYGLLWLLNFSNATQYRKGRYCIGYVRAIRAF